MATWITEYVLHVQKSIVERIISVLISSKLCAIGKNNNLVLPNADMFADFILYYRQIIEIDKGIGNNLKLDLPAAAESRFHKILTKLNQLFPSR